MTEINAPDHGRAEVVKYIVLGAGWLASIGLAVFLTYETTGSFDVSAGKDGFAVKVSREDNLVQLVNKIIRPEDPEIRNAARAILRDQGVVILQQGDEDALTRAALRENEYVHLGDPALADAIEQMDYTEQVGMRLAFEKMLYEMKGPFRRESLHAAPATFIATLEALKEAETPPKLREEMLIRSLEHKSPFDFNNFNAEIRVLPEGRGLSDRFYICDGQTGLTGKFVKLSIPDPEDAGMLAERTGTAEKMVIFDSGVRDCRRPETMAQLLLGEELRFYVTPETAQAIFRPGGDGADLRPTFKAQFQVRPRNMMSADLMER